MREHSVGEVRSADGASSLRVASGHASHNHGAAAARASGGADSAHAASAGSHADQFTPSSEVALARDHQPSAPQEVGPDQPWSNQYALEGTTSAHRTNTPEEMDAALKGDTHWFEGDCRLGEDGQPVMAHDKGAEGLSLKEWLRIGGESGRGLKIEAKEPQIMGDIIAEVKRSGVPADRLMFNLGSGSMDEWGPKIRKEFPDAILAISTPDGDLTPQRLDRLRAQADSIDGINDGSSDPRVAFVLNETQVSDQALKHLEPVAPVSVWNSPGVALPGDTSVDDRVRALQERGVTGVIDIREDDSVLTKSKDVAEKLLEKIPNPLERF